MLIYQLKARYAMYLKFKSNFAGIQNNKKNRYFNELYPQNTFMIFLSYFVCKGYVKLLLLIILHNSTPVRMETSSIVMFAINGDDNAPNTCGP